MIDFIYQAFPKKLAEKIEREADYLGIDNYANFTVMSLIIGGAIGSLTALFIGVLGILLIPVFAAIGTSVYYFSLVLRSQNKKRRTEKQISDALRLVSSNLKSGQTLQKSFLMASRDEFKPFSKQIEITANEMYSGLSVEKSLQNLRDRTRSSLFKDTITLLIDGVKSGGDKAKLIEISAEEIEESLKLRKKIKSSVRMYSIFILIVVVIAAPILFAISVELSNQTSEIWEESEIQDIDQAGPGAVDQPLDLSFEEPDADIELFYNFAIVAIILLNGFASLIIAEIRGGTLTSGIKWGPLFIIISTSIFLISQRVLGTLLGTVV